MLKKIDWAKALLEKQIQDFRCVYCGSAVCVKGYSVECTNHHSFNLSKKGTLHLMKQPANVDYDESLFLHRYEVMQAGLFTPLLEVIEKELAHYASGWIVDIGCGEGSHLSWLINRQPQLNGCGIDIAKAGIVCASNHFPNTALWLLADLTQLPFSDESCSVLLNILSPSHYGEFNRVLAKDGVLIKVVPGEQYLKELREVLYADNPAKLTYSNQEVKERFLAEYKTAYTKRITYQVALTPDLYEHLLEMTPLFWGASKQQQQVSRQKPLDHVTLDVELLIYRKGEKE